MDAVTLALLKALGGGSGGSGLPSIDSASAGDVLSLDSNKDPQWAAPSGGGGVLVVGVNGETGALDKTAGELLAAVTNGLVVVNEEIDGYIDRAIIVDAHYNPDEAKHYSFGIYMGSYSTYSAENSTDYPTRNV